MSRKILIHFLLLFVIISAYTATAQINTTFNYQARLTDNEGMPFTDGLYYVVFNLYRNADDIEPIWSEEHAINTRDGFFSVILGTNRPIDDTGIKFEKNYYLGFAIIGSDEFVPRTELTIVPYSFTSKRIEFPYRDTIETESGIVLHKYNEGSAFEIHKSNGKALQITNRNENSSSPAVSISDSGRGSALHVTADGFRSYAGYFATTNTSNRVPTVQIYNYGFGNALYVANENKADTMPALSLLNQSQGYSMLIQSLSTFSSRPSILLNAMGSGGGAELRVLKTDNVKSPLIANTWGLGYAAEFNSFNKNSKASVIRASSLGKSPVAFFGVYDENNDTTGLIVYSKAAGKGVDIRIDNLLNENPAVNISTTGKSSALAVSSEGIGSAAKFASNAMTYEPTVYIESNSSRPGLFATNTADGSAAEFVIAADNRTNGPTVFADHLGGGRALEVHSGVNPLQPALRVRKEGIDGVAAEFFGHVKVNGELQKMSGSFVIDHPLDPANKLLVHSFVESPDMKNIYDGVVVLNANGEAIVTLPDWFEALNKDFRYQLTCIGAWAQVYISEEISDNKFKIAGGKPGMKVSWMVTGIRKDPWAEQNRIKVEKDKSPSEIGKYLYQEYYQNK